MKCDTDSIISILYKVESEETIKPIFFHNGTVPPDVCKSHIHIKDEKQFAKIHLNILCIRDYALADVRDHGSNAGVTINRITHKGSKFLVKAVILKAINEGTSSERAIAKALDLSCDAVNLHLKQLAQKEFIFAAESYPVEDAGRLEYISCALKPRGKVALEDPSFLVEESNMANNEYNFNAPVGSVANQGTQTNVTGVVEGDQIGTQYNSPQEKTLAQAAAEIQKLLKQLEQTNPNATPEQQQAYVDAAISPTLKERCVSALKAGSETAIDEFFDNPFAKVGKAIVMAWIQP